MNHLVIIAGMCTLIGTSTNLIVHSMLVKAVPDANLGLFDLAWVGVPLTAIGFVYILVDEPLAAARTAGPGRAAGERTRVRRGSAGAAGRPPRGPLRSPKWACAA